mmetsp:Transcript_14323/g.34166  ORF Transcript_14323/g.34166 Transcript_14323/m.34166 type:complete len:91 (-) Transcript_14323:890-1162(-)
MSDLKKLSAEEQKEWWEAIHKERDSIVRKDVGDLVDVAEATSKILPCKIILTQKPSIRPMWTSPSSILPCRTLCLSDVLKDLRYLERSGA